jgi:MerR family copper efflux transcriptional regulator
MQAQKIGLISQPLRTSNGYRRYNEQHLRELKFIKYAKSVGFSLNKIKLAIPHLSNPKPDCPVLQQAVTEQLQQIDDKIEELKQAKITLSKWITPNIKSDTQSSNTKP